jgi:hypothetical protein
MPPQGVGMFNHPFAYVMAGTFVAAIAALLVGILNLAGPRSPTDAAPKAARSTTFMFLRVGLCMLLLMEIIYYVTYIKPGL